MWPFKRQKSPEKIVVQQRKFAAAQMTDLLSRWTKQTEQINKDIKEGGAVLRARARDAAKNNDYGKKYLNILRTNVVGEKGIRLQCRALNNNGKPDTVANDKIETGWKEFTKAINCSFDGQQSMIDMQELFITTLAQDGEVLVRIHADSKTTDRLRLQFLDVGLLDEKHNQQLKNGRQIVMGIEYNASGTVIAFHLTDSSGYSKQRQRVPATEIIHKYRTEFAGQRRGFSWMSAALVELHHLNAFQEAAIIASRIGASSMGFFTEGLGTDFQGDDKDPSGDLIFDMEPGTFRKLPMGVDFKSFESKYPSDMVDGFMKRSLKSCAAGLNVSYNSLAADPESTSYGTLRQFALEDRDYFRTLQRLVIESFLEPVYLLWLRLNIGRLLKADRYEKMTRIRWQPRGWLWIDPAKDAIGFEKRLAAGLTAPSFAAAEMGLDFDEVCQQAAVDKEKMQKLGLLPKEMEPANAS